MVNHQFKIVQMGNALPDVLMRDYDDLVGLHVDKVFKFTKPVLAGETLTCCSCFIAPCIHSYVSLQT